MLRPIISSAIVVVLVLGIFETSHSQVNIESLRLQELDYVAGSVGGSFAVRSGNVEFYSLGVNGRVDFTEGKHDLLMMGRVNRIQDQSNILSYTRFGHARYNYDIKSWWQWEIFGQAEFDQVRLLNQRLLLGSGMRFRIHKSSRVSLHYGTTPMLEIEHLSPGAVTGSPNSRVARWSNYLSWRSTDSAFFSLVHTTYVQPRFDQPNDIRILNESSIDFSILSNLSLGIIANLRYDSRPPPGIRDFDFTISNSLKVGF